MVDEPSIESALAANRLYGETFKPSAAGNPKLAVVLCMDARIDPIRALGLKYGYAHIIRNAGGRVADALRSLSISQRLVGTTEVAIIHHTDCAMTRFTDADMRKKLREEAGMIADHLAFLPFTDHEQSILDDLQVYRASPLVRQDIVVRGFIYDVDTGLLREVFER